MIDLICMPIIVLWYLSGLYDQAEYEKSVETGKIG
jgi:hypothetical protein